MNGIEAASMRMPGPSAAGKRFFEKLSTRCEIPPEPAETKDSNGHPILPVQLGSHDLNLSKTYANWIQGFTSIRELMQNWYDRTLEVLKSCPTALHLQDTGWVDGTRLAFHELRTEGKPRCASYVLEQRRPDGKVYVQLTNFATELPKDALIMGCSRKSTADAAGAYGEGMKVEINCLVARGVTVWIFTGSRRWDFVHHVEVGSSESKLFMQATAVDRRCAHLSICLLADKLVLNEVDRSCFLFLQPAMAPDLRGGDEVVEVLLHKEHRGKTFARGIIIKSMPTLQGIGLNFIAPLRLHKTFGFTRDRDDIDLELLIAYLPFVVSHAFKTRRNFGEALVKRLYKILQLAPDSDIAKHLTALSVCYISALLDFKKGDSSIEQEFLADKLVGVFQTMHHDKAQPYPIDKRSSLHEEEMREATFLQCTPVEVSEPLLKHLRLSKLCPTTEQVWIKLAERVYELADWQPPSKEARLCADRFRSVALQWFGDALSSESLRVSLLFKEFPDGNQRVVVIGRKESSTILAVDVKLLDDSQATHEWVRKEHGQDCIDKQPDGTSCGGACTMLRYSEALTQCLEKIFPQLRGELAKRQKMAMMRMQTRDLPNQPLPPPPPPKPHATSGQRDDQDAVASTPTASSASGGQHKRKLCSPSSRDELNAMPVRDLTQLAEERGLTVESGTEKPELVDLLFAVIESTQEDASGSSGGQTSRGLTVATEGDAQSVPKQRRGAAYGAEQSAADLVRKCLNVSSARGGTRPDAAIRSAGVAPRMAFTHVEQCTCDGQSALGLFELTVTNGFRGIGSSKLPAYHEGTDVFDGQRHGVMQSAFSSLWCLPLAFTGWRLRSLACCIQLTVCVCSGRMLNALHSIAEEYSSSMLATLRFLITWARTTFGHTGL